MIRTAVRTITITLFSYLVLSLISPLYSFDLAQFYRANFFYGQALNVKADWETLTTMRLAGGSGTEGFECHGHKSGILNNWGCANINRLGFGVQTENPCATPSLVKPLTAEFLSKGGIIPSYDFICGDGTLSFCGKFKTFEIDIDWWQNLRWGFFMYGYLPIRRLEIEDINYINNTRPNAPHAEEFQQFLDTDFNAILGENCLLPTCTPFCKTSLSDPALFIGWHGDTLIPKGFVSDLAGLVEIGVTFPINSLQNQKHIFALPPGYNEHWLIGFRIQLEGGIKNWFSLGFTGGAYVYLCKKNCIRLATDCAQSGPIVLERAHVDTDPHELWDVGGYIKADRFFKGLSLLFGYSYTKQERTRVDVQDCQYLAAEIAEQNVYGCCNVDYRINQNSIANTTRLLQEWDHHVLHFMFELDLDYLLKSQCAPIISFAYDYPFTGKNSWQVPMISGTLGLHIKWDI